MGWSGPFKMTRCASGSGESAAHWACSLSHTSIKSTRIVHMPTDSLKQLFPSSSPFSHSELQPSEHLKVEGSIWLPLNVVSNGNASSSSQAVGVTKIAKSVIAPLAQQHVSVFMLSTYQTDFILVSSVYISHSFFLSFFFPV